MAANDAVLSQVGIALPAALTHTFKMADISKDALRKEITAILKDADLATTSAKKVRQQIEEKLDCDLSERRKEIDELVMDCLEKKQGGKKEGGKKRSKSDDEEESEEQEESEEESEQEEPKGKRSAAKKPPPKKAKKASSDDESEEASNDDASDEEYSPAGKKGKAAKKPKAGKKKKGSDSDDGSDEDWNKSRRAAAGAAKKAGGGAAAKKSGGGGGYTRAYNLSPELAAVMGVEKMARHEVVRKMWSIIKEKNLYDPKNKQFAICNDELLAVFGVKRFRTFGMMKYLKNHFVD